MIEWAQPRGKMKASGRRGETGAWMGGILQDHRQACDGFTDVARQGNERWESPSPCPGWDARGVLEHVIGFHDVLLLKPLEAKPTRPKDDPVNRWAVTVDALFSALSRPVVLDEKESLIGYLTIEVLVHTWDLSKASGVAASLDPRLCRIGLDRVLTSEQPMPSEMFHPALPISEDASVQDRLLGAFGRDPGWARPS